MTFVKDHRWRIAAALVAVAVVVLGKQFYRDASAADLRWILAPTAKLVSWFTGGHFTYEAGAGYADYRIGFIIAPPCAGLNFAMAAFLTLLLGSFATLTSARALAARIVIAATAAYVSTIVVNTIRISIAVAMHRGSIDIGTMDRAEAHRLEGILVYLGGLCLLYALARAIETGKKHVTFAIPIAAYLVITLGLPLVNGAGARGEFAHHAMWVLAACAAVMGVAFIINRHAHRRTA